MKTYKTQEAARYGLYTSTQPLDMRFVGAEGEPLDGIAGAVYRRIPTPLALAVAPVLGGVFVLAFPVLVIAAVAIAAVRAIGAALRAQVAGHAWLASPRWEPAMSYLSKGDKQPASEEVPPELADLHELVQERRADEDKNDQ